MGTHSYVDTCDICGGNANVNQNTRPQYTSSECYDCGWYETDQEGNEGSGFMDLNEINNLREMVDMDYLTMEQLEAVWERGYLLGRLPVELDEYACVINRVGMS
jgi:hypothetical protein